MQVLRMTWMFNIMDYNFMIVSCLLIMTRLLHVYYCVVLTIGYCIIFGLKFPFKKGWMWGVMYKKGWMWGVKYKKGLDVRCDVQKGSDFLTDCCGWSFLLTYSRLWLNLFIFQKIIPPWIIIGHCIYDK